MHSSTVTTGARPLAVPASLRTGICAAAPLVAITFLGAALRLWAFARVPANPFYDAAVRSMSLSWSNFFFGAFEPGAQVSVDKPPADLWLQVASVKLLGFSGVALRLPEVVAGILAIPVLFDLVRRLFGRGAGLGAAAAFAVLPTAIVTAHSDTMDAVMMLFDLLAAWLVVVGAQERSAWRIIAAGAVLGIAFNVKLFEGLVVLPALGLLALLGLDLPARRRALALGGGATAFVAVSLSWIVAASLTPLGRRPWPIGSTNGSIWNAVFGFNGIDRLSLPATRAALAIDPPGPLRLFNSSGHGYAATVGTMLLAALVLGAAATAMALAYGRHGERTHRLGRAGAAFLGTWLVSGVALLSHMQRLQPRYLEAVTPAIAAVVGVGLARLSCDALAHRRLGAVVFAGAVTVSAVGALLLVRAPAWAAVVAAAAAAGSGAIAASRARPRPAAALAVLGLVAVLAVPVSAAATVARQHRSDAGVPLRTDPARLATLSGFLIAHRAGARYEVASPTVVRAAPLIIRDGRPVLMMTSLHGRPLLGAVALERLVASGQVRYALLGRTACSRHGCPSAVRWARAHARDVSAAAGQPPGTVYRLRAPAGRAGA